MSELDLPVLACAPEGERLERKASASDVNALRRTICAFANALGTADEPGVILVGLHDDGRCAGLSVDDALVRRLADLRSDGKLHPFPTMQVTRAIVDGCEIVVVRVEPSDNPPVKSEGRAYVRVGSTTRVATAEEERRLVERRRWANLPFDQQPVPQAELADLDLRRFELELLPALVPPDVLEANERTREDQLRALRLLRPDGRPTVLAVLLLGRDPLVFFSGAYVQLVRFAGRGLGDPIRDQKRISGTLLDQFRQLDEIVDLHIERAVAIGPGPAIERPTYPSEALRELARNALIHRNYEMRTTPVRISWFDDRVEITSPGGPYGLVTRENFGRPNVTDYRNPGIAEVAARLGYAQRFGTGIARARAALARNGNPDLEFLVEPTFVTAIVRCVP